MAKRRQLEAPSPEQLKEIEEGFARETPLPGSRPPIADVVADAAALSSPLPQPDREAAARLQAAEAKGLIAVELPIDDVRGDALTRDRMQLDENEMRELTESILAHGLRLPIEVFEPDNPEGAGRYALISGFRRLAAFRQLYKLTSLERFARIPAFVRQPASIADTLIAMIEENEIRVGLSQYERGRAASMAVYDGYFKTLDEAVNTLFQNASKAKRSKIRSFAMIHEELGDLLKHAPGLSERQCLRLAGALRAGGEDDLRSALGRTTAANAEEEWARLETVVEAFETQPNDPQRGGRPRNEPIRREPSIPLANGISIEKEVGPAGYAIRFHGKNVSADLVDAAIENIRHLLEKI